MDHSLRFSLIFSFFCLFFIIFSSQPVLSGNGGDKILSDSGWIDAGKYKWVQAESKRGLNGVYFSKFEKKIYTFNEYTIKIWDSEKGTLIKELPASYHYLHFAVSPDEKNVYLSSVCGMIIYSLEKDSEIKYISIKKPEGYDRYYLMGTSRIFCTPDGNYIIQYQNVEIVFESGRYSKYSGYYTLFDKLGNIITSSGYIGYNVEKIFLSPNSKYFVYNSEEYWNGWHPSTDYLTLYKEKSIVTMDGKKDSIINFSPAGFSKDSKFLINYTTEPKPGKIFFYNVNEKKVTDSTALNYALIGNIFPNHIKNNFFIKNNRRDYQTSRSYISISDLNSELIIDTLNIELPDFGGGYGDSSPRRSDEDIVSVAPDSMTIAVISSNGKLILWKSDIFSKQLVSRIKPDNEFGVENVSSGFSVINYKGNPTSWLWDFGDGSNSTEQNPEHTFKKTGEYNIRLVVSDGKNKDTCFRTFSVRPDFDAKFIITKKSDILPVQVEIEPSYKNASYYSYYWTTFKIMKDSLKLLDSVNYEEISYAFKDTGSYKIKLKIDDSGYIREWETTIYIPPVKNTIRTYSTPGWKADGKTKWLQADTVNKLIGVYFSKFENKIFTFYSYSNYSSDTVCRFKTWDSEKGTLINEIDLSFKYHHFAFSRDEKTIYFLENNILRFYDIETNQLYRGQIFPIYHDSLEDILPGKIFSSPYSDTIVVNSRYEYRNSIFDQGGRYTISGNFHIINKEGKELFKINGGCSDYVAFSKDKKHLAFPRWEYLLDYRLDKSYDEIFLFNSMQDTSQINQIYLNMYYSEDSKTLAAILGGLNKNRIDFIDSETGALLDQADLDYKLLSGYIIPRLKNDNILSISSVLPIVAGDTVTLALRNSNGEVADSLIVRIPWDYYYQNPLQHPIEDDLYSISPDSSSVAIVTCEGRLLLWQPFLDTSVNDSTKMYLSLSSNTLTLNYTLPSSQPVDIQVSGILGNVIYEKQIEGREGSNRTEIDMAPFTNGIYFVRLRQGDKVINTKFFKD